MVKKGITQDFYNALLVSAGAVAVSMVSKTLIGQSLVTVSNLNETLSLAFAVTLGSLIIEKGHSAGYIPRDSF